MAITYSPKTFYQSAAERLRVLDTSAITFTKCRAPHAAASLAYYTLFSIFPLMLLFILGGSYFLGQQNMLQRVTQAVQSVLPISQPFVVQNLEQVLKQRTTVGIFVLVSLLWSASSMFNNLAYEINSAWPEARNRNFLQSRLIGVNMIAGLTGLLIASVVLDSLAKSLGGVSLNGTPFASVSALALISDIASWLAVFLLYLAMYHWVPTVPVAWSASTWGALAASIGWKAATTGFSWYLASPFARYQLVYGSLGAIIAFLFLVYIIALVTLYGAHLTAAVDHLHQQRNKTRALAHRPGAEGEPGKAAPAKDAEVAASPEAESEAEAKQVTEGAPKSEDESEPPAEYPRP